MRLSTPQAVWCLLAAILVACEPEETKDIVHHKSHQPGIFGPIRTNPDQPPDETLDHPEDSNFTEIDPELLLPPPETRSGCSCNKTVFFDGHPLEVVCSCFGENVTAIPTNLDTNVRRL